MWLHKTAKVREDPGPEKVGLRYRAISVMGDWHKANI
jgi:hypothetical protein